jgi:hypothetical protein
MRSQMASADSDGENNSESEHQLLKTGVEGHWDPDEDRETFWEDEEGPANK